MISVLVCIVLVVMVVLCYRVVESIILDKSKDEIKVIFDWIGVGLFIFFILEEQFMFLIIIYCIFVDLFQIWNLGEQSDDIFFIENSELIEKVNGILVDSFVGMEGNSNIILFDKEGVIVVVNDLLVFKGECVDCDYFKQVI